MSAWTAKGDTPTTIIMWLGGILAIVILALWFARTIYPTTKEIDILDNNLKVFKRAIGDACTSEYYRYEFNPSTITSGYLNLTNQTVCITIRQTLCTQLLCNTNKTASWNLENLITLVILHENKTFTFTPNYAS
ncbi:hypothetical protein D6783_03420 [Candidatus Woesearchaeota archaeon]|nr:MAG: hypothetical protein D6783_03420 [Candidatus Woesearchaeota archaeon]